MGEVCGAHGVAGHGCEFAEADARLGAMHGYAPMGPVVSLEEWLAALDPGWLRYFAEDVDLEYDQ